MVPGRLIGEAYISLLADASLFKADADAKVNAVIKSMRPSVKVTGDFGDVDKNTAALAAALKGLSGDVKIDTRGFIRTIAQMETAVRALMERLDHIPVDVNDTKMLAKIYGARGVVEDLAKKMEHLDADGDLSKFIAKVYGAKATVEDLESLTSHINVDGDFSKMEAKIQVLIGGAKELSHDLENMRANVDDAQLLAKIAAAQGAVLKFAKSIRNLPVTADTLPFEASLYKLIAQVQTLKKTAEDIRIGSGARVQSNLFAPGRNTSPVGVGGMTSGELQGMKELAASAMAASMSTTVLNRSLRDTGPVATMASGALEKLAKQQSMIISSNAGGWMGAAATKIRLFGGALDSVLPKFARAISVWHLAADIAFEFAAAWAPAAIAVGAFAAYAIPTGQKIYGQWKNINTMLDGVGGKTLPDLGRQFDQVQRAIQPSILIAFGEYMQTVGKNGSALGTILAGVGHVIDHWGASFVQWLGKAQAGFNNLAKSGTGDFALIGEGFHQLFRIIGMIIKDMPGIVHVMLPAGDAFLKLVGNVVSALGPVLKFGLLLHGVVIYAGLATTAVIALGRAVAGGALATFLSKTTTETYTAAAAADAAKGKFSKFGLALGQFAGGLAAGVVNISRWGKGLYEVGTAAENVGIKAKLGAVGAKAFAPVLQMITKIPLAGWMGIAAVAIGVGLYFAFRHTTDAAQQFAKQINAIVANSDFTNIQQHFQIALQKTTSMLQQNAGAAKSSSAITVAAQQDILHASGVTTAQTINAGHAQAIYGQTLLSVVGQAQNYHARLNDLVPVFGSVSAAQNALNLAGIKATDVAKETDAQWQNQLIQLKGLAAGYGYMGNHAAAAGAQLNALNISTGTTYKNVQALTQAETGWITLISGSTTTFTTFEQGQNTLNNTLKQGAKAGATVNVTLGSLRQTYAAVGATMKGTSTGALAAQQAFAQQLQSGVALYGNLQTLATASGNTATAQNQLAKSGRDIIAQMLPFVAGNKEATAQLSSLAQLMGGPATSSFQVLAKWVGNTKGAEGDLYAQQSNLTISASNLSAAAKNLGNALQTQLVTGEAATIAKTFGLDQAMAGLAANVAQAGHAVNRTAINMAGEYVSALTKAGMSTKDATSNLNAYLARLGYTPSQIKAIDSQLGISAGQWNKYEAAVNHNTSALKNFQQVTASSGSTFKNLSTNWAMGSVAANALWHAIVKQDAGMLASANHAGVAKVQFIQFAENGLGLSARQASALWNQFSHQNLDQLSAKAANTKNAFIAFAEHSLRLTQTEALDLWKAFAQQNLDMMITKGDSTKKVFINFAMKGLNLTTNQAITLWNTLKMQYLDTLAVKAGETRQAFEKTAAQFGVTKAQADKLWASLHQLAAGSPYGVNVNETLSGKGRLTAAVTGTAVTIASTAAGATNGNFISASNAVGKAAGGLPHHAAGYLVPSGHTPSGQDGHLAMLAPGELVIPTSHVPAHRDLAKKHGIPGLAGGGFGNWPTVVSAAQTGIPSMAKGAETATNNAIKQWVANINSKVSAAQAAMGGAGALTGGSVASLLGIARYLMTQGFNKAAAAGVAATISGECVTLDSMILTKRGWLKHDEVAVGDETIGYNPETGKSEWTTITRVMHYGQQPVVTYGNQYWQATFTPNHRWLTETAVRVHERVGPTLASCPECDFAGHRSEQGLRSHMGRVHRTPRRKVNDREVWQSPELVRWDEFTGDERVILSREADTGLGLPITDQEAALLGWVAGDGSVTADGRMFVYQSKPQHFAAIEDCIGAGNFTLTERDRRGKKNAAGFGTIILKEQIWFIRPNVSRDLIQRAGNPKTDAFTQVLSMSSSQRHAWLGAVIAAEGNVSATKTVIYQNEGNVAEAIELAVYLEGHRPSHTPTNRGALAIGLTSPTIGGPKRRSFTKDAGLADVWCVTTELGSWTARNESGMWLTGNSGGNPESRNCVPLTYKVVTERGVLSNDEVRVGDRVPGYNTETGRLEVATILDVPYHYDAEMCRIGNKNWSVVCTVDHKWITERGLIRADRLTYEDKVLLGAGWSEVLDSYERLPNEDTFCLTTTTGTWTVIPDNSETPVWTGNSGGWGLIGWTGNTVGLPGGYGGPTGNYSHDMAMQLAGVVGYARARGGIGALNAAGSAVAAGNVWSRYEAPLVPLSDTRPSVAAALFAQLASGGLVPGGNVKNFTGYTKKHSAGGMVTEPVFGVGQKSGLPYSFAERGSEYVGPLSGGSQGNGNSVQSVTVRQGQVLITLLQQLVRQGQQLPQSIGRSIGTASGQGVMHGYYGAGG